MHVIMDAQELKTVCQIAQAVAPKQTTLMSTKYLTIDAQDGKVVARATNLEQMVIYKPNAEVVDKGVTSIPIKRSLRIASFEKHKVGIRGDGGKTNELMSVNGKLDKSMTVKLYNADMGDVIPIPPIGVSTITLPDGFQKRMSYSLLCVCLEETRPVLSGVMFNYDKDSQTLDMVSADGFRLIKVSTPFVHTDSFRVIIPRQAVWLASKYMKGSLKFGFRVNTQSDIERVWFENDTMMVISQAILGKYPEYKMLIPSQPPELTITVSAPMVFQRLSQLRNETPFIVRMAPTDDGLLRLTNKYEDLEESEVLIPATINGVGKIAFNANYLLQFSKVFSEMTIAITQPSSPMLIRGDLEGVTVVCMPMFVAW